MDSTTICRFVKLLSVILAVLLLTGCVSPKYYTPAPDTHIFDKITEFKGSDSIALINNQPSQEEQLYHAKSKHHANYHKWTEVAVQVARRELEARGFTVRDDADKSIKLSIHSILTETGWTQSRLI